MSYQVEKNKILLKIQNNKYWKYLYIFVQKYIWVFQKSTLNWKYFLIIAPLLNLFIFSWFIPFIIIMITNFILYKKIYNI